MRRLHPDGTPYPAPYPLDAANNPRTVTLDEAGNVYVGGCVVAIQCIAGNGTMQGIYRFEVFDPAGKKVSQFGAGQVLGEPKGNGLAVDEATGTLYVASSEGALDSSPASMKAEVAVQAFAVPEPGPLPESPRIKPGSLQPSAATLEATLNPEGNQTEYRFEYGTGEAYGHSIPVPPATLEKESAPYSGFEGLTVQAQLSGLTPGATYHYRLVAANHCKEAEPEALCEVATPDASFTALAAVGIEAQWASAVSARGAKLDATLDPRGAPASWRVEYDTSPYGEGEAGHGTRLPVPDAELPAAEGGVAVEVALSGLEPATTYHYRFVATDEREGAEYTVQGADQSFATQAADLGFALPDSRAWELVSPAEKGGALIAPPKGGEGGQVQAAADGEALAFLTYGSLESPPQGNRLPDESSALARRGPGGSWSAHDISPPHTELVQSSGGYGLEYPLFSADLGALAAAVPRRDAALPLGLRTHPVSAREHRPPHLLPAGRRLPARRAALPGRSQSARERPAGDGIRQGGVRRHRCRGQRQHRRGRCHRRPQSHSARLAGTGPRAV